MSAEPNPKTRPFADEDFYQVLGVGYAATAAEITRAYRLRMKEIHPDRQRPERRGVAEERAKTINVAYEALSRPETRRAYDATIRERAVQDQIMNRYVGGYGEPGVGADPFASHLRHKETEADVRARRANDRNAMVSLLLVFGGITVFVMLPLLFWSFVSSAAGWLY